MTIEFPHQVPAHIDGPRVYHHVQSAVISPFSIILKTMSGVDILSNDKFILYLDEGDKIVGSAITLSEAGDGPSRIVGGYYEVIGKGTAVAPTKGAQSHDAVTPQHTAAASGVNTDTRSGKNPKRNLRKSDGFRRKRPTR